MIDKKKPNRTLLFNAFFNELNKHNIKFCIMNGYEHYPEIIGSDIDICIDSISKFKGVLEQILSEIDGFLIQQLKHAYGGENFFITKKYGNEFITLGLDIYESYKYKNRVLFTKEWFLNDYKPEKIFFIPNENNEFTYYLVKKIIKQDILENLSKVFIDSAKLTNLSALKKYFPISYIQLTLALKNKDENYFVNNKKLLQMELLKNSKYNFIEHLIEVKRLIKRILKPTGFSLSILGPDGSGKSTIINLLNKKELPFRRISYFHLRPSMAGQQGDGNVVVNPHEKPVYKGVLSYLKVIHFSLGYFINIPLIQNLKIKSSLIIFDRYFEDFFIDPRRFRYGGNLGFVRFINKLLPRPDINFVLTAHPKIIYNRKQEVSFDELERQLEEYKALQGKGYIHVDVGKDIEHIVSEIESEIVKKLNERCQTSL